MTVSAEPLIARVRALWEGLATAPVSFAPNSGVSGITVVSSPTSRMCPPGWAGIVVLGDAAIVTAPTEHAAETIQRAIAGRPVHGLVDPETLGRLIPLAEVLGPASLAYLDQADFQPARPDGIVVEQVKADHPDLRRLAEAAGADDAGESGIDEITSPAFVVRAGSAGEIVAAAGYRLWPSRTAQISVLTAPVWRGRGLARAAGSSTAAYALEQGLLPQWRARLPESRRVARALGFRELGTQLSVKIDT